MLRLIVIAIFISLTVCTSNPPLKTIKGEQSHIIYVVSHGWHAGIVLPKELLVNELKNLPFYYTDGQYFEIGWGDSGFYQNPEVTFALSVKALLWPTDSVMHIVALPRNPIDYFTQAQILELSLTDSQIKSMIAFIANSFATDENNIWRYIGPGLYGQSRFFHGNGTYHGLYTCNSWTAEALAVAGVPMNQWFSLTSESVMLQVEQANLSLPKSSFN